MGNNLKKIMFEKGYSTNQLALELGITRQSVINLKKEMNVKEAKRISQLLGVNLFDLLGDDVLKLKPTTSEDKAKVLEIVEKMVV